MKTLTECYQSWLKIFNLADELENWNKSKNSCCGLIFSCELNKQPYAVLFANSLRVTHYKSNERDIVHYDTN